MCGGGGGGGKFRQASNDIKIRNKDRRRGGGRRERKDAFLMVLRDENVLKPNRINARPLKSDDKVIPFS